MLRSEDDDKAILPDWDEYDVDEGDDDEEFGGPGLGGLPGGIQGITLAMLAASLGIAPPPPAGPATSAQPTAANTTPAATASTAGTPAASSTAAPPPPSTPLTSPLADDPTPKIHPSTPLKPNPWPKLKHLQLFNMARDRRGSLPSHSHHCSYPQDPRALQRLSRRPSPNHQRHGVLPNLPILISLRENRSSLARAY